MVKALIYALSVSVIAFTASAAQAAQTDPLTHLTLYPGAVFASKNMQDVCGTKVSSSTYGGVHGNLATVDRWYAGHLAGFKIIHGTTRNYPYDIFVNADETMSVTILGSGPNTSVEGVVYHHNAKPAASTAKNITNWLDGSDSICR